MFCDLAGSTSLAAKLDAEDWRNLVNAYLDEASRAVTALGGHVLKMLGDGLMAVFGYPRAQENDAERAVQAALAIQRALGEINAGNAAKGAPELPARIGLGSGPVVVEASGEVFGEASNIAARVQGAAEAGMVVVTAAVQIQTAGLFVAEDRGACELKGVPALVTLYRIVRASGGRRTGARALTPSPGARRSSTCCAGAGRGRWLRPRPARRSHCRRTGHGSAEGEADRPFQNARLGSEDEYAAAALLERLSKTLAFVTCPVQMMPATSESLGTNVRNASYLRGGSKKCSLGDAATCKPESSSSAFTL